MYIYIYMHIHLSLSIYLSLSLYIYIYVYLSIYIYIYTYSPPKVDLEPLTKLEGLEHLSLLENPVTKAGIGAYKIR